MKTTNLQMKKRDKFNNLANLANLEVTSQQKQTLEKIIHILEQKEYHLSTDASEPDNIEIYKHGEFYINTKYLDKKRYPNNFLFEHVIINTGINECCFAGVKVYEDGSIDYDLTCKYIRELLKGDSKNFKWVHDSIDLSTDWDYYMEVV